MEACLGADIVRVYFYLSFPQQLDYQEVVLIRGFMSLDELQVVEEPRHELLYGGITKERMSRLHGMGFSLIDGVEPLETARASFLDEDADLIVFGSEDTKNAILNTKPTLKRKRLLTIHGEDINYGWFGKRTFVSNLRLVEQKEYSSSAVREYLLERKPKADIILTGLGIPSQLIMKKQTLRSRLFASYTTTSAAPWHRSRVDSYLFESHDRYYHDMNSSCIGLTAQKGGWDCLRHYEIISAGALLCFRRYHLKPRYCAPIGLPTLSYSNQQDLQHIANMLSKYDGTSWKLSQEGMQWSRLQRHWLFLYGTCSQRALDIVRGISADKNIRGDRVNANEPSRQSHLLMLVWQMMYSFLRCLILTIANKAIIRSPMARRVLILRYSASLDYTRMRLKDL